MLLSDIGINISGYMHILFKKGLIIPSETELTVKPICNNINIMLYQGPKAYVAENHLICSIPLINSDGIFSIKFILNPNTIQIYIEDLIGEFPYKKEDLGESTKEELINRENEIARQIYTNYIQETLLTLEEIRDKIDQSVIDKVIWAGGVSDIQEVTKEEFELSQQEIEMWLNPILEKLNKCKTK